LGQETDDRADDEAGHHDFEVGMPAIHRIRNGHKKSEQQPEGGAHRDSPGH
jgi:hypothetical protein